MKIAVLADIHYGAAGGATSPSRRGDIADILFLRAVRRINRFIKPDLVLILGDVQDDGRSPQWKENLARLRATADLVKSPWLAIPGNHDAPPGKFYSVFPRPPANFDLNGVRFASFLDREEPGFNASRSGRDLERMRAARSRWRGPVVTLQHVPLFPPGNSACPYNYVNAREIIAEMRRSGIGLAISGHYHEGFDLIRKWGCSFLAAPALCRPPFSFLEIELDGKKIAVVRHDLRMPEKLKLWDMHVHTPLAYCSENMDVVKSLGLAESFGLSGLTFAEHSGQLYFDKETYWSKACLAGGIKSAQKSNERMEKYFALLKKARCRPFNRGLEVDCCYDGSLLALQKHIKKAKYLLGSIHALSSLQNPEPAMKEAEAEFLALAGKLVRSGIDVLAHPFRVFSRKSMEAPQSLYDPLVKMLHSAKVSAEVNFHTQNPDPEFYRRCLEGGVKLVLGSDAHNLYEVGEFTPHLALLKKCGIAGDPGDIIFKPNIS